MILYKDLTIAIFDTVFYRIESMAQQLKGVKTIRLFNDFACSKCFVEQKNIPFADRAALLKSCIK